MDDGLRGDPTTGAWSVFDNEGLAHARGEPLTDQARQDVGRAAGGESDNETNGTGWVAARTCEWRGAGKRGKAGAQVENRRRDSVIAHLLVSHDETVDATIYR